MKWIACAVVSICLLGLLGCASVGPREVSAELPLYSMPEGIETRWASHENPLGLRGVGGQANAGRKGAPVFPLPPGEHYVLAHVEGSGGTLHRIWMTINIRSAKILRGIRLDMYWDGAATPAVSVPVGDFFGHGLGQMAVFENALFSSPEGKSFNCALPMPFKTGMKLVLTNETDEQVGVYYDVNYTLGDRHGDDMLYFHATFRRENPTTLKQDFEILPRVEGRGRFLGTTISVIPDQEKYLRYWWGEGEVKVYLDGDEAWPTLVGTGTEDYIGTGWGQGRYDTMFQGCHIVDAELFRYCFYRLHIPDPVYFYRECRVTMQQIGCCGDAALSAYARENDMVLYHTGEGLRPVDLESDARFGLFERVDDWAACTYFYLDRPENNLPPLPPLDERLAGLE